MEHEHPASMTARAVKQALPDRAVVTKDARVTINTATSMFTLYLSTIAHDISTKNKRSTITLKDVLAALKDTDFEHFVEPVEQCLLDTKAADARKRARKEAQKTAAAEDGADGDGAGDALEAPAVPVATGEQDEEVPMETDADLDGEQTIDEDEEADETGEEEEDGPVDEPMEGKPLSPGIASSQVVPVSGDAVGSGEDATMEEETKQE